MIRETQRTLGAAAVVLLAACAGARSSLDTPTARAVQARYMSDLAALEQAFAALDTSVRGRNLADARRDFRTARQAYKRIEFLIELYNPGIARSLNGAPIAEIEEDDPNRVVIPAEGFQVVEAALFATEDPGERTALDNDVALLRSNLRQLRAVTAATVFTDAHVFDAARLEVMRVATVGLTGFDASVSLDALPEAAAALEGVRDALAPYARSAGPAGDSLTSTFDRAIGALGLNADFERFDRLAFITNHAIPVAQNLLAVLQRLGISLPTEPRAWRPVAATPFGVGAFDAAFFAAPGTPRANQAQVNLGRILFFDPVLSGGGQRACASCHRPDRAFTDGRVRSLPADPNRPARLRNAPTIINAGLQPGAFYDLRTAYLEDQVTAVVSNRDEMHGTLERAAAALEASTEYRRLFVHAFGADSHVTADQVRVAIAAYVRSLVRLNAPFDRYVRGDRDALSESQRVGFNLFMGKARCGTCHFAPLFNGAIPPVYDRTEVEVLGVPEQPGVPRPRVDPDEGRFAVTRSPLQHHAFKTPTVRNVELTAPYMHNGAFGSLEDVVDFYNGGGGHGIGIELDNQTLPADSLRLSGTEKRDLVAFLKALTDTAGLTATPATLPRIPGGGPLAARVPGGRY